MSDDFPLDGCLGPAAPAGSPCGETAPSPPAAPQVREPICVGYRLKENLHDSRGTLLIRAGTVVTERMMELLRQWQVGRTASRPTPEGPAPGGEQDRMAVQFSNQLSDALDRIAERGVSRIADPDGRQLPYRPVSSLGEDLDGAITRRQEIQRQAAGDLQDLAAAVLTGARFDADAPGAVVSDLVDRIWSDPDLLLALAPMRDPGNEYLFQHAINVCTLSILMAQHAGYGREQLRVLGLAALLHDIGMLRVPEPIRSAPRVLGPDEMYEVMKHPFYTVEMLERLYRLPEEVPLIAYQVHERSDAGGYPRKRHPNMVHPFAKLIAVADVYNAMIGSRPWRKPVQTYSTMVELLSQTSRGRFDRQWVRALVERVGLFPVGSVVVLSNGLHGAVRRANPGHYARPIVEVIGPPTSPKLGAMVDLVDWPHLEIARCTTLDAYLAEESCQPAGT